ncbi:MAG: putative DNA-binding protein with PD1-like DNA-binding motif [Holophagaceae bacterium]|nr:putative DNA-binding protein with PD1-like DNA-binding motif [Holophagaceae bacterium]
MRYSEARPGRIFILRLEDGDIFHECVEQFAVEQKIKAAALIALGAADAGSRVVCGPAEDRSVPIVPMEMVLERVHEISGTGTLFPDAQGQPILHFHLAGGRSGSTFAGCGRRGVKVWHVMEVVLWELLDSEACRHWEAASGFELLKP